MITESPLILSVIGAVFASTGFWAFLSAIVLNRKKQESAEAEMLRGLGHDRLCFLGSQILARGFITKDEHESLYYLYLPYKKLGGNSTVEKIMKEVDKLPIKEGGDTHD